MNLDPKRFGGRASAKTLERGESARGAYLTDKGTSANLEYSEGEANLREVIAAER
jgi:hypothetical protein